MNQQPDLERRKDIYNGYYSEVMIAALNRQTASAISMVQVVLSSAVMADVSHSFIVGLLLAVLSAWQFVYKPGEKAAKAKEQSRRYERLIHRFDTPCAQELDVLFCEYIDRDSDPFGPLIRPASIRAMVAAGEGDEKIQTEKAKLTRTEKFFAAIAGGIPD